MSSDLPVGPTLHDWANASLQLTKFETANPEEAIYEIRKSMVINGVEHVQFVVVNQQQLRSVSIEHGL